MTLIAHDQGTEVAQPSEQALDLPTALKATQLAAILGFGVSSIATVRAIISMPCWANCPSNGSLS